MSATNFPSLSLTIDDGNDTEEKHIAEITVTAVTPNSLINSHVVNSTATQHYSPLAKGVLTPLAPFVSPARKLLSYAHLKTAHQQQIPLVLQFGSVLFKAHSKKQSEAHFHLDLDGLRGELPNEKEKGWKLHIAVAKHDVATAWDVIVPFIIRYGITRSKVINDEHNFADPEQAAKAITLYQFKSPKRPWQFIICDIEKALHTAGIQPIALPNSNEPIADSHYISYRYESHGGRAEADVNPFDNITVNGVYAASIKNSVLRG